MIFLGLDIGSSGCKCVALSESGNPLGEAAQEYLKQPGQVGLDAEELFSRACTAVTECVHSLTSKDSIVSITVSSFGESFVPVDRDGQALSPISMYTDGMGLAEAEMIRQRVPSVGQIAGGMPNPLYALPRMMQMLQRPDMGQVWKFLQIADFVIFRLCGEAVLDYSLACRALAFDVMGLCWSKELLSAAGLRADQLSQPVPAGTIAGRIHKRLADALGLPAATQVVVGAHDQVVAATGAGALDAGEAVVGTGSVECIIPVFGRPILHQEFIGKNYVCIPHTQADNYVTYAFTISGGAMLSWYRDRMVPHLKPIAKAQGRSVYDLLNETCPTLPSQLLLIPHFGGTGTPELNSLARGTISGLSMNTGLPELYRAILEGLCFEMCHNREQLEQFGITFSALRATGGGAKSPLWLQLKADILGIPIIPLETADAGAVGAAMIAAVSFGRYSSLSEAAQCFVKTLPPILPDPTKTAYYRGRYQAYRELRYAQLPR